ncbi:MAG TPA: Rieske 2Fe-2S domain-containing protein, partial [Puia sp.]|nr:Rieske 2Fe-2S domain-containing protein [Puia sp.]
KDKLKYEMRQEGFSKVCTLNEIDDNRAKIFCLDQERIAIFKTDGRLFAINNVCKHQNGPLGEGKIIDGCITCPWHGYQYLPHNGQSPPPFKEKVSTYDVKIVGEEVWLHPKPYTEGTERPGAQIHIK